MTRNSNSLHPAGQGLRVTREEHRTTIHTTAYRLDGIVYTPTGASIAEALNASKDFVAVTDAVMYAHARGSFEEDQPLVTEVTEGTLTTKIPFIALRKEEIVAVIEGYFQVGKRTIPPGREIRRSTIHFPRFTVRGGLELPFNSRVIDWLSAGKPFIGLRDVHLSGYGREEPFGSHSYLTINRDHIVSVTDTPEQ